MYRFRKLFSIDLENKEEKLWNVEPRLRQTLLPLLYVIQSKEVEDEFIKFATDFQNRIVSDRSFETEALIAEKLLELMKNNDKVTVKDVAEHVKYPF